MRFADHYIRRQILELPIEIHTVDETLKEIFSENARG